VTPELSVVIATWNRAPSLRRCLDALANQTAGPDEYEIIVVNDGSQDETEAMLASLRLCPQLRVITIKNSGQPAAQNIGAAEASGNYLLFIDDDVIAAPSLIEAHLAIQRQWKRALVMGHLDLELASPDHITGTIAHWWREHYERLGRLRRLENAVDFYGGNSSLPTAEFHAISGFRTDLPRSYDAEFAWRVSRQGLPLIFEPAAAATQYYQKNWRDAMKDSFKEGVAAVALSRMHEGLSADLPLSRFSEDGFFRDALRRTLLTINCRAETLGRIGEWFGGGTLGRRCHAFVLSWAYWSGAQQAMRTKHGERLRE
jgi:glycosyltransferase involved in cell wall biosynthesis